MKLFTVVAIALVAASAAAAPQRETPAEGRPAFAAATIKPAAPDAVRNQVTPTSPNRLYIPGMTLTWLIYTAYGDGGFNTSMRVTGGPDWVNGTAFAVEGEGAGAGGGPPRRNPRSEGQEVGWDVSPRHARVVFPGASPTPAEGRGQVRRRAGI